MKTANNYGAACASVHDAVEPERQAAEQARVNVKIARDSGEKILSKIGNLDNRFSCLREQISALMSTGADIDKLVRESTEISSERTILQQSLEDVKTIRIPNLERLAAQAESDFQQALILATERVRDTFQAEFDDEFIRLGRLFQDYENARRAVGLPNLQLRWRTKPLFEESGEVVCGWK